MAEHKQINRVKPKELEEESRYKKKAQPPLYDQLKAPDEGVITSPDFVAKPSVGRYAALLANIQSDEQRANLVAQLQQAYGNAYVQQIMARIQAEKGSGKPLEPGIRLEMETAFNQDFGDVRIHADAAADKLARELGANAFTSEEDIFFRESAYKPGMEEGKGLLAHELTHVAQQEGGIQSGNTIGQVGGVLEQEASQAGRAVSEGRMVSVATVSAVPALQRQLAEAGAAAAGAAGALSAEAETARTQAIGVLQEAMSMLLTPNPDFSAVIAKLSEILDILRRAATAGAGGVMGAVGGLLGRAAGAAGGLVGRVGGFLGGLFG